MKKILLIVAALAFASSLFAQNCYWVFLTDKQGTTFDPYTYFDPLAVQRYKQCGADLYDISNYPLNANYVSQIDAIVTEEVGQTRWFNAVAVMATPDQMNRIEALPFVKNTRIIANEMQIAAYKVAPAKECASVDEVLSAEQAMAPQLLRMQGEQFAQAGINGKGVRVAVFDAGFPRVNTHDAFKHLRDNGQIKMTWNFPSQKEDVYGWGSHGTMVLSCIAGKRGNMMLGLATGSDFLLARTEVDAEPFKEEVWWMMAVEWADKNGAMVINSSLGYGKERHYTYEMDGRSYVAKAANMAARKGMLVCNSAGNEGTDNKWKTIITPADADSVLTVGGIDPAMNTYRHINFSSYGPTADGRMKPNVCNFGHVVAAATGSNQSWNDPYGTSFSSPLTAGFCACAWQTRPGMTAMQMKAEVEKSADLYPYFDYAFGYGVPQASYFVQKSQPQQQPTFKFVDDGDNVKVVPVGVVHHRKKITKKADSGEDTFDADLIQSPYEGSYAADMIEKPTLFLKATDPNGKIEVYRVVEMNPFNDSVELIISKKNCYNKEITVHYAGYTESYRLNATDAEKLRNSGLTESSFDYLVLDTNDVVKSMDETLTRTPEDNEVNDKPWSTNILFSWGNEVVIGNEMAIKPWSPSGNIELLFSKMISKKYSLGFGFGWAGADYNIAKPEAKNELDQMLNLTAIDWKCKTISYDEITFELFQRVRIVAGGVLLSKGLFWDLGVYGSRSWYQYTLDSENPANGSAESMRSTYYNPQFLDANKWNFGVTTRIAYDVIGVYARYRLTQIGHSDVDPTTSTEPGNFYMNLPRLEVGFSLAF